MVQTTSGQRGGKREGAGRPKGALGGRAREQIEAVAERWPDWSPLEHFAAVANDETLDADIRLDAAKAAAPFIHAKLKPVVADVDELIEIEARIAAARLQAQADTLEARPGLADRLLRVMAHLDAETPPTILQPVTIIEAEPQRANRDPEPVEAETPAGAATAPVTVPEPMPTADAAIIGATPPAYNSFLPWPDRPAFAEMDYDPTK